MNAPSERDVKKLFALSMNQCAFPDCVSPIFTLKDEMVGEICHIKAKSRGGPRFDENQTEAERHSFDNLILLCRNHHKIVDDQPQKHTVEWLKATKYEHENNGIKEITPEDARLARRLLDSYLSIEAHDEAQVMVNSPGGIQAKHVTIKTTRKTKPQIQPVDSIGANSEMRAYIQYLVKRYVDWRLKGIKSGKDKRRFHPSMIHKWIERDFGDSTYYVLQVRFESLVEYLQELINGTIFGGFRKRSGERNYHSFEDHLKILRGQS